MSVGKILENKGFTLFELLVVMVIISLMSAVVIPRLAGSLNKMNSETAAKKILASLRYARSQAVSERVTYLSVFDFYRNQVVIRKWEAGSGKLEEEAENSVSGKIYDLPEGVRLKKAMPGDIDSGLFQIAFYPGGNSSGGEIIVADGQERQYKIKIDFITGTVQLTDGEE